MSLGVSINGSAKQSFQKMPRAYLAQEPPVQNTWYTILDTTKDIYIYTVFVTQINDELAAKDVEVRATINSVTASGSLSQANNSTMCWRFASGSDTLTAVAGAGSFQTNNSPLHCLSAKIEMRTTSTTGSTPKLRGGCQYSVLDVT